MSILLTQEGCAPCKMMKMAMDREGLTEQVKVLDVQNGGRELAISKGIRGVPALINNEGEVLMGAQTIKAIKDFLKV